jgi:hypothetical protein
VIATQRVVGMISIVATTAFFLLLSPLFQQYALAHKPIDASGTTNNNFQNAIHIPDPRISWAVYQNLNSETPALFYEFHAQKSQQVFVQLSIPQLRDLQNYNPRLAIIGPDVSASMIIQSESTSIRENDSNFLALAAPSSSHNTHDDKMISLSYKGEDRSTLQVFNEPFTQTSYWEKQKFLAQIPRDGQYFVVVYVSTPEELQGNSKFTLAVGQIEDFKPIDYVTTLPLAWIKTKLFFEDYISIFAVVLVVPILIVSAVMIKRRRKRNIWKY